MRHGGQLITKVEYAGCTAAAAPARYQVTLPLKGALISLYYHHLRRAAISSCLNSELSLETLSDNLILALVRVRQLCILKLTYFVHSETKLHNPSHITK